MHPSVSATLLPLLCSALLCGVLDASALGFRNATTPIPSNATGPAPTSPNSNWTTPVSNLTTPVSSSTTPVSSWTTAVTSTSDSTVEVTTAPPQGLSDGAIAGIVIGSIGGVGLVGGGIFGLLKYTGKI